MTPTELSAAIRAVVEASVDAGELDVPVPHDVVVERPRQREHGDYATNVAMRLAKPAKRSPREVATLLAGRLTQDPRISTVEVAGPGFLNIRLAADALGALARTIIAGGTAYGRNDSLTGQNLNLEFVSANPTGPPHIGAIRWAAVGDALARVFRACGAAVTTEYYFNDAGSQIDRYVDSLIAAAKKEPTPADGYPGQYIEDIAATVVARHPDVLSEPDEEMRETFRSQGVELMFAEIKGALAEFGVHFDVFFNERDLHTSGRVDEAIEKLRAGGHLYDKDGALWLRSSDYGDDRDRPIVRSNGQPTYFAGDIAYYVDKRDRGFDKVLIMLGADHHGYIGRMRAMVAASGDDPDQTLEILIGQMVKLLREGEALKLSKRAGTFITMDDLVDSVGVDAGRYALARSSIDSTLEIDLDLWSKRTSDNPVYYVQYAHARLSRLQRNAADLGLVRGDTYNPAALTDEHETNLLTALGEYPRVVAAAGELREVHRVARYAETLAGTYHRFYDACRVLPMGDDPITEVNIARLWLCEATRVVLANALDLLGVSAPEQM